MLAVPSFPVPAPAPVHGPSTTSTPSSTRHRGRIKGWLFEDIVFEHHTGTPPLLPKHAHDTYQIGTTTRDPGEYLCNGERWSAPPGSMMVFHPGEVHSAPSGVRQHAHTSRIIFVAPSRLQALARGLSDNAANMPRFAGPVIRDARFIGGFTRCYDLVNSNAPVLEKESALLMTLGALIHRFGTGLAPPARLPRHRNKVESLRGFIEAHYDENTGLAELSQIAQISPYHLSRLFAEEVGMPPHAYQTQLRVQRAKSLLLAGMPVAEVAVATGFFDQSHLTRHFRRIVGVAPSGYLTRPAA